MKGRLVVCRNLDVPGVIGRIGTILGQEGVNIANFALGRERGPAIPGNLVKALAVVQVDEPVAESALEALKVIEALLEARLVKLAGGK
ncbi:MAG: ACT domain-containing protein [Terracidiphilus sp.]